jgi:Cu-Zn family superoxide dismutase
MNKLNFYKNKYLKYKTKYITTINNQIGGQNNNIITAIAFFDGEKIKGTVKFEEIILNNINLVKIKINLIGFEPNTIHGFHVHESGDLTKGCDSMCAHFNPYKKNHGGREDKERHVGDLGNINADSKGDIIMEFNDELIKLQGDEANIIGRGLIIHADKDDCGKGVFSDSKTTGHSGKRIACAIIGHASILHS